MTTASSAFDLKSLAQVAMLDKGFNPNFPPAVLKEVAELRPPIIPLRTSEMRDLRPQLWFSLDNDDSRDLDQLTFAESLPDGKYKLYIAVANVDLLVKKDSAIDHYAAANTTSVYTPAQIFPMLPEHLSTDLTSLNPGEDRLAVIFEGIILNDGNLETSSVYLAYVHNHAKLAYNGVSAWLDEKGPMPTPIENTPGMADQIRLQDTIAQILAKNRHSKGALSLETIEGQTVFSNNEPVAITPTQINRGRILIENFMVLANTISSKFSEAHQIPSIQRVVTVPKRWDKIREIATDHNTNLPLTPDPVALEKFLVEQKQADPISFPDLSLTIIKLLGNGEYRVLLPGNASPGHFGLALRDYSHSTAPNRRFPDLITQRLILATLAKQSLPYTLNELNGLADHCTQKEDDAQKVERQMRKSAAAIVLSTQIGKEFDGIVTGVNEKGTWVRIFNPPVDGKLLKGIARVDVGDRIRVKLIHTDIRAGYIDFVSAHQ